MLQSGSTAGTAHRGHDRAGTAARSLRDDGFAVLSAAMLTDLIGTTPQTWEQFDRHWDDLTLDGYMNDGGTYRHRRFGHYTLDTGSGVLARLPHGSYRQESTVNPLNGGIDRHFDPLTDAFAQDPLVTALVRMCGGIVAAAEQTSRWIVDLHPFRIVTSESQIGKPAPQGRHRDGVTFVTSLVVARTNITGGTSSVYTDGGDLRRSVTLSPGDGLLLDDRRLQHDVTPVLPADPAVAACRDVLLIDFTLPGPGQP